MKTLIKFFAALLVVSMASWSAPNKSSAQVSVSLQLFYDDLSPYGNWVNYPAYGNVWVPGVGAGFIPYSTGGHWVLTTFGWTWVSDYPWGWAPFHYGRWNFDPIVGWLWIPGRQWGPAWVSWRRAPGYYGWAPLGYGRDNDRNDNHNNWVFVNDKDIDRNDLDRYQIDRSKNADIIRNSNMIDNKRTDDKRGVSYNAGPDANEVRKVTGRDIKAAALRDNDKPGQKIDRDEVRMFRPEVKNENAEGKKPEPAKVISMNEARAAHEKNTGDRDRQNLPGNQRPVPENKPGMQNEPRDINNNDLNRPETRPKQDNSDNEKDLTRPKVNRDNEGNMQPEKRPENPNDKDPREMNEKAEPRNDHPANNPEQSPQMNGKKENVAPPAQHQKKSKKRQKQPK
ncbi:MAG: DUF6600 domain-containing protein [Chitinophagales bacterium]